MSCDKLMKLIFIRHGETQNTKQFRLYKDSDDPPLTQTGKNEIYKSAQFLQEKYSFDALYTSPLLRARQSAEIIAEKVQKEISIEPNLIERRAGIWGGLTLEEIKTNYPQEYQLYKFNKINYKLSCAESIQETFDRTVATVNHILEKKLHDTILVVTHAGIIKSYVAFILNMPLENIDNIYFPTASITEINFYNDWKGVVLAGFKPH